MSRTEVRPLSPDDVAALRQAGHMVFYADSTGRAGVRAILAKQDPADFTKPEARIFRTHRDDAPRERTREFRVDGFARSCGLISRRDTNPLNGKRLIGFHSIISARFDGAWRTAAKLMKVGYCLELQFLADHSSNGNHAKVGFHGDDLFVRIWTPVEKNDLARGYVPTYEILLDTQVGPHDSARMVRAEGDAEQGTTRLSIDDYFREGIHA